MYNRKFARSVWRSTFRAGTFKRRRHSYRVTPGAHAHKSSWQIFKEA